MGLVRKEEVEVSASGDCGLKQKNNKNMFRYCASKKCALVLSFTIASSIINSCPLISAPEGSEIKEKEEDTDC